MTQLDEIRARYRHAVRVTEAAARMPDRLAEAALRTAAIEVAKSVGDVPLLLDEVDRLTARVRNLERMRGEKATKVRAEKAEAALRAVEAWADDYDNHQVTCAYWQPFPAGTTPVCDCSVAVLRNAVGGAP